jgi:hypothetical protein
MEWDVTVERTALLVRSLEAFGYNLGSHIGYIDLGLSRGFPQSLKAYSRTVSQIRPRPLPSTYFPVHYLIVLPFDVVGLQSDLLVAS